VAVAGDVPRRYARTGLPTPETSALSRRRVTTAGDAAADRWQTPRMDAELHARRGGDGTPVLLLLHGLGATGDVWRGWEPLLARRWPGRWVAPDLPGHGRTPALPRYTVGELASAVARAVKPGDDVVVLGHSLGGVVGLALAAGECGVAVRTVVGLGIKVQWTDDDLGRAGATARRPVAWFDSREEAAARYLRVSGLAGLLPVDDPAVDAGLREEDGRWRLAVDPAAFGVGAPDVRRLVAASAATVLLARGEHDPMNTDRQLADLGTGTVTLPRLGHNAHVEDPEACASLLDPHRDWRSAPA
jgi:pimeloyl-ACP methyl ester carboxylesterase